MTDKTLPRPNQTEIVNVRYIKTKDGATYLRLEDVQAILLAFAGTEDTDVRTRCEDLCRRLATPTLKG